ncbi:MAG: CopD family protein [Gallionellaceae bacterium]
MLWIKAFHIILVTSWFAGLFYLPRIFVNLAMVNGEEERSRLLIMSHKLYRFVTPIGALALITGLWLWLGFGFAGVWLHIKLTLVLVLIAYHFYCGKLLNDFKLGINKRSHVWFRFFNEVPVIILLIVVILVTVKPI